MKDRRNLPRWILAGPIVALLLTTVALDLPENFPVGEQWLSQISWLSQTDRIVRILLAVSGFLLLENLYGDIISDLCAAFVGGLGLVPGANFGNDCAIFEAVHGSAPDIAGKNLANPTAVIRSGLLMLRHLGEPEAALKIRNALEKVYRHRDKLTRDVGGKASTSEFADAIIEAMQSAEVPQTPEPSRA